MNRLESRDWRACAGMFEAADRRFGAEKGGGTGVRLRSTMPTWQAFAGAAIMFFDVKRIELIDGEVVGEHRIRTKFFSRADAEGEAGRLARQEGAARYDSARGYFLVAGPEREVRFVPVVSD